MGKKKGLPRALARRASALAKDKKTRVLQQAHDDIALVKEKQDEIAAAFYEMGMALARLAQKTVMRALGHGTFEELLRARVGMSVAQAEHLMLIVEQIDEADAIRWKQDKSLAVANLKKQPGVKLLGPGRLQLPSKEVIDVEHAQTAEIERKAEIERHRHQRKKKRGRGRTTSPDERKAASDLKRALGRAGVRAQVRCVATKPGKPSDVEVRFSSRALEKLLEKLRA